MEKLIETKVTCSCCSGTGIGYYVDDDGKVVGNAGWVCEHCKGEGWEIRKRKGFVGKNPIPKEIQIIHASQKDLKMPMPTYSFDPDAFREEATKADAYANAVLGMFGVTEDVVNCDTNSDDKAIMTQIGNAMQRLFSSPKEDVDKIFQEKFEEEHKKSKEKFDEFRKKNHKA
jgi:hypothetical protein